MLAGEADVTRVLALAGALTLAGVLVAGCVAEVLASTDTGAAELDGVAATTPDRATADWICPVAPGLVSV